MSSIFGGTGGLQPKLTVLNATMLANTSFVVINNPLGVIPSIVELLLPLDEYGASAALYLPVLDENDNPNPNASTITVYATNQQSINFNFQIAIAP